MRNENERLTMIAFVDPNAFVQGNPELQSNKERFELQNYIEHAKIAENAGFDAIFKPDFLGLDPMKGNIRPRAGFEPLTLLTALSQHTEKLGLIVTESTSYTEPFNIARYFTSLDHLSNGRAGWNVVTSYYGEENFGDGKLLPLSERYKKADEYLEVVNRLWNGWGEKAIRRTEDGFLVDGKEIRSTDFAGTYFNVKQPLDLPPGPQRRPVIIQAGASEDGLDFASRHAEIVFTATPDFAAAQSFYHDLKSRIQNHGRSREDVKILPGLNIFVASSSEEAKAIHSSQFTDKNLLKYKDKIVREAPLFKLSELKLDEPIPSELIPTRQELEQVERRRSRGLLLREYFTRPGATLRDVLSEIYEFGHWTIVGTPKFVADEIERWFTEEACDGFVLKGGNSFRLVAEHVLPKLHSARLGRDDASGPITFRDRIFGNKTY